MATAYRRDEDGVLVAQYMGADGKKHQERLDPERFKTIRDARRHAQDLEDAASRQRAALEGTLWKSATFADLVEWWERNYTSRARSQTAAAFLRKHTRAPLGPLRIHEVTSGAIERLLVGKEAHGPDGTPELSAKSVNHLRSLIGRVFKKAAEQEVWTGRNPVDRVPRRKVTKRRNHGVLSAEEAKALLYALDARWRGIVATALFLGPRKGEILGLLKKDVDLANREILVTRSYEYDSTKGNREDRLPIPEPLVPFLEAAIAASPSDLVFPNERGEMYARDTKLTEVVRRGLSRAGIVLGYDQLCRRSGCGFRERHEDPEPRWCPQCGMKLWPKAIPRRTRFHDLRHTTATLLLREGVPMAFVQKILRHSDITVTEGVYGHLDMGDLRQALARMPVRGVEELARPAVVFHPGREAPEKFAAEFAAKSPIDKSKGRASKEKPLKIRPFKWSGRQDLNLIGQ